MERALHCTCVPWGTTPALLAFPIFSSSVLRDLKYLPASHHLVLKKKAQKTLLEPWQALGNPVLKRQGLSWRLSVESINALRPSFSQCSPWPTPQLQVSVATRKGRGWKETGTTPSHSGSKYSRGYKCSPGWAGQAAILKAGIWSKPQCWVQISYQFSHRPISWDSLALTTTLK